MKLFVSYRRAAWSFTYWLVEELNKLLDADIFVDYSGVDETNFEKSLLRNLRGCDAVLLIVDEHTFAPDRIQSDKDWVRREIREALTNGKPIVMACHNGLFPPADLPEDIAAIGKVEGIEFYARYFKAGVNELATFFDRATPIKLRKSAAAPTPSPDLAKTVVAEKSNKTLFNNATLLAQGGQYDAAITLLRELKLRKYRPRSFSLDDVLADVTRVRDAEQRRWEAGEIYDEIAALARVNQKKAQTAWKHFLADYPDYTDDPAQLASKLMPTRVHEHTTKPLQLRKRERVYKLSALDIMPSPFAWIDIPAGKVTLLEGGYVPRGGQTFDIPTFFIAKYPVTNAQFAKFVEANGYSERRWWTDQGWDFKESKGRREPSYWQDTERTLPDYPVVGVTWFEAVAFCLWLSEITNEQIALPTDQQWQRAAQGDTTWDYPWGNEPDRGRFSTGGTPVTQYEGRGNSPFGVVDMIGNVYEWSMTDYDTGLNLLNATTFCVLRGGESAKYRGMGNHQDVNFMIGFRITRT